MLIETDEQRWKKMEGAQRDRLERYPLWSICHHEYKRRMKNGEWKEDGYPTSYSAYFKIRITELQKERDSGSDNR